MKRAVEKIRSWIGKVRKSERRKGVEEEEQEGVVGDSGAGAAVAQVW